MKKTTKRGFTIVELVIVIAVIAILAAVLIPTFSGVIGDAKDSAATSGANSAYTQYLMNNTEAAEIFDDFIFEDSARVVVITDGNVKGVFADKTAAENFIKGNVVVPADKQIKAVNYNDATGVEGLTAYKVEFEAKAE